MTAIEESELARVIEASAAEVLETMFFTPVLDEPEPASATPAVLCASLTFAGDPPGILQIDIAEAAARNLAADFLGSDASEVSAERAQEVACELANMLCGSILSRVEPNAHFDLSSPEPVDRLRGKQAVSRQLYLPSGTLMVSVQLGDVP